MWQHRKPRSPSHQSSSLRRTRCERKRAITVRTLPCAYTNIWRPQTVAMRESRMTRNGHVRFGERGRETRLPQGRKVRSAPTLFSPVLANIYLNQLDQFVETHLIPKHTRGQVLKKNPAYRRIQERLSRARRKISLCQAFLRPIWERQKNLEEGGENHGSN